MRGGLSEGPRSNHWHDWHWRPLSSMPGSNSLRFLMVSLLVRQNNGSPGFRGRFEGTNCWREGGYYIVYERTSHPSHINAHK